MRTRVGKVWKWSNLVLIKVVVFFIKFDKNFVWTKYFFHTYCFSSLGGPLLAGLCSGEPGPVSRACSKVKKPYVWKKYFVQTNFLSNLVKKSTTFINTKLLQFHTLPTLPCTLVSQGLMLPLRNWTKKRMVVFNTLGCSEKELQSGFSKDVWPFF